MLYGNKTGTFLKDKKDKSFITKYLSFYLVPRPDIFQQPLQYQTDTPQTFVRLERNPLHV